MILLLSNGFTILTTFYLGSTSFVFIQCIHLHSLKLFIQILSMCWQALGKLEQWCISHWRPYLPCRSSIMASIALGDKTLHVPESRLSCQSCYMFWSQEKISFLLSAGINSHGISLADGKSESALWPYFNIDPYFPRDSAKDIQLLCSLAGWSVAFHNVLCTVLWAPRQPMSLYFMSVKTSSVKAWC